jgi:hypothetical protein
MRKAAPQRGGPRSFPHSGGTNLRRWPPPSSHRDLASVVRVLLGGDLISRSALAGPDPDRFPLRGGYRVGTDFPGREILATLDERST